MRIPRSGCCGRWERSRTGEELGWVRCGAVRCGAVRCGAVGAVCLL